MGAHHYDIAQWALDMDDSGPVEIIPPDDPNATTGVKFIYANGIEMIHGGPSGCDFYGRARHPAHRSRPLTSDPEEIVNTPLGESEVHLPKSPGHHRNWLDCIQSREKCDRRCRIGSPHGNRSSTWATWPTGTIAPSPGIQSFGPSATPTTTYFWIAPAANTGACRM